MLLISGLAGGTKDKKHRCFCEHFWIGVSVNIFYAHCQVVNDNTIGNVHLHGSGGSEDIVIFF